TRALAEGTLAAAGTAVRLRPGRGGDDRRPGAAGAALGKTNAAGGRTHTRRPLRDRQPHPTTQVQALATRSIKTLGHYRMSPATEEEGASIPRQREWAARACAREGLDVVRSFEDAAVSGGKIDQRPGLLGLLAEAVARAAASNPVQ